MFADQLGQDRRFWQAVRVVFHAELGTNLLVGCLVFTERKLVVGGQTPIQFVSFMAIAFLTKLFYYYYCNI